jgi:hypothetical protein
MSSPLTSAHALIQISGSGTWIGGELLAACHRERRTYRNGARKGGMRDQLIAHSPKPSRYRAGLGERLKAMPGFVLTYELFPSKSGLDPT